MTQNSALHRPLKTLYLLCTYRYRILLQHSGCDYQFFIVSIKTQDSVSLLAKYQLSVKFRNVLWKASVKLCLLCLSYCTPMIQPRHLIT